MVDAKKIYLNNAAGGFPVAPNVTETVCDVMNEPPAHAGRGSVLRYDWVNPTRTTLAEMFHWNLPERIIFTPNLTYALNLSIFGIDLQPSDCVVTTLAEHNSVLRPLRHLQQRIPFELILVDLLPDGSLNEMQYQLALARRPKLVVMTHASNVTGLIFPIQRLFAAAKSAGSITLLDAAQTVGAIDLDANKLSADIIAFTGYKGLHGPSGIAGMLCATDLELSQLIVGGTGVRSTLEFHPPELPMRHEAGTMNIPAIAGMSRAVEWYRSNAATIHQEIARLRKYLIDGLRQIKGVTIYGATDAPAVGIVSFNLSGWNCDDAAMVLQESFGIECRAGLHCAPLINPSLGSSPDGTIRFSLSSFNTVDEIEYTVAAVAKLKR